MRECASRAETTIQPLHPATTDPELATYFVAQVKPAAVERLISDLIDAEGIDGVYEKPPAQPPERNF